MSKPTVTPEKLQRWDELTRAALVQTNPLIEQPLGVAMARAEWGAACVLAMPALIAEVKRLTAELAQTQALLEATQPFAHDVDVLHGILSDERQRAEAAEQERDGAITLLGKQVMENTFIHQRLDAVAVDAAKERVRVAELESQLAAVTAELAQTQALLEATQPFAHDVDVLHGILSDERQRAEAAERKLNDVLPQYVAQMADAIKRAEAAEAEANAITWIPVAERSPEPDLRVLAVYSEEGHRRTIIRALYLPPKYAACYEEYEEAVYDQDTDQVYFPGGWYEATEDGEYAFVGPMGGTVTHWMQLPALP